MLKSVTVVNHCAACDSEIVGRNAVEAMVLGRERAYVPASQMRKCVYSSGEAMLYGSRDVSAKVFRSVFDDEHCERFIRCRCQSRPFDVMDVIRDEHREAMRDKFGGEMTASLLMSMPVELVAWESFAMVCVDLDVPGLKLAKEGVPLIDVVRDMSMRGIFSTPGSYLKLDDVLIGFSHLHMIRSLYRPYVAADFGPHATLGELFSKVPLDWFDWQAMLLLRARVADAGRVEIVRQFGVPLTILTRAFLTEGVEAMRSVVAGTSVPRSGMCIQFMPSERALSFGQSRDRRTVILRPGQSFLPIGDLLVEGQHVAVTIEPGFFVRTSTGSEIVVDECALTMFLNGSVQFAIHRTGCLGDSCGCADATSGRSEFAVAVSVDSYAPRTKLRRWYERRFDPTSSLARFMNRGAEFVVFHSERTYCGDLVSEGVLKRALHSRNDGGHFTDTCTFDALRGDSTGTAVGDPCIIRDLSRGEVGLVVDGVKLTPESAVGFVRIRGMQFVDAYRGGTFADAMIDDVTFSLDYPVDDYVLDGGGPSDDEGFFDETATYVDSQPLSVLRSCSVGHVLTQNYLHIAEHRETAAHYLGVCPSMIELLRAPMYLFSRERIKDTSVVLHGRYASVVRGKTGKSWRDLFQIARSWLPKRVYDEETLMSYFRERYRSEDGDGLFTIEMKCN